MDWDYEKIVQLQLTLVAAVTSFNNTYVAVLAAEKHLLLIFS